MRTHIRHLRHLRLVVPALGLLVAGCFKLSREAPAVRYYALGGGSGATAPSATATASTTAAGRGVTLGLRRVDLASYLSNEPIAVRRGASQVDLSDFHRWAGDLDEGINRAVSAHLVGMAPVRAVDVAPWAPGARHDYFVQLHVSRFEGLADSAATEGRVHVQAGWDIVRARDNTVLVRGATDDRGGAWRVGDYAGLVTGLDAALSRLARDISACLARFPNDSTPPASCGSSGAAGGN